MARRLVLTVFALSWLGLIALAVASDDEAKRWKRNFYDMAERVYESHPGTPGWRCTFVVVMPGDELDGDCLRWDREGHQFYPKHHG